MLRGRDQLALTLVAAIGLLVSVGAVLTAVRTQGPIKQSSGIVTQLDYAGSRSRVAVTLTLADGQLVHWSCGQASCWPSARALEALAWETPMPAEMAFAGGRLVGLTVREAEVIVADEEIGRRAGNQALTAIGGSLAAGAAGLALYFGRRRPAPRTAR